MIASEIYLLFPILILFFLIVTVSSRGQHCTGQLQGGVTRQQRGSLNLLWQRASGGPRRHADEK